VNTIYKGQWAVEKERGRYPW